MKKVVILLMITFFICSCGNEKSLNDKLNGKVISCSQIEELEKENENILLVDVRTKEEYLTGHLDEAINVPLDDILSNKGLDLLEKDVPIIVYCRSGSRSAEAMDVLLASGYTYVFDLGAMNKC